MADCRPVLVTGAGGIVGRAAVAAVAGAGMNVWPVTRSGNTALNIDLTVPFEAGLGDIAAERDPPGLIVHLAAAVPHDPRYPDTPENAALTRAIDRHVLAAATAWDAHVVYMSSGSLYERGDPGFQTPDSPLATHLSPYQEAKLAGEHAFREIGATVIRLSAPAGSGLHAAVVMKRFVDLAHAGAVLEVWGNGSREQDFIHVDDVADLLAAAAAQPAPGTYNCARGEPTTMAVLAHAVVDVVGRGSVRLGTHDDPCDGETRRYSIGATGAQFGWAPRRTLADMIRSVAEQ